MALTNKVGRHAADGVVLAHAGRAGRAERPTERGIAPDLQQSVRERIAFYGSTPAYRQVLDAHGFGEVAHLGHEGIIPHGPMMINIHDHARCFRITRLQDAV